MAGRHGGIAPDGEGCSQAATEVEAIATATVIAGLRSRLRKQEILEHPKVVSELRKLEQQLGAQLGYADRNPGRHRSEDDAWIDQRPSDAAGDLMPNPCTATTPAEFIQALWQYKAWSGDPSWRRMATRAGQAVVHSTMYAAMNGDVLPKFDVVRAIIIGCGGGDDDLESYTRAWQRIQISLIVSSRRSGPDRQRLVSAPISALITAYEKGQQRQRYRGTTWLPETTYGEYCGPGAADLRSGTWLVRCHRS